MMLSISYYINPNTRALTSNYKNTVIKDKEIATTFATRIHEKLSKGA